MKIEKIEFKNFQSYGNNVTTVELKDTGDMTLILGSNGAGKSCIAKVITYLCYGKVDGIAKGDIPNRINKNFWGRITMTCSGHNVIIERGINPDKFSVVIDDEEFDTAGKLNTQAYLENEVFGIPYSIFKNMIILSVNDFQSFVIMSPGQKREIIDRLFGFSIINELIEEIKNHKKLIVNDLNLVTTEINTVESSMRTIVSKLNEIKESMNDTNLDKERDDLTKIKEVLPKLQENIDKTDSIISKRNAELTELVSKKASAKTYMDMVKKNLKIYESGICPTCGADLTDETHEEKRYSLEEQLTKYKEAYDDIDKVIKDTNTIIRELNSKKSNINNKMKELNSIAFSIKSKIDSMSALEKEKQESFINLLSEFSEKRKNVNEKKNAIIKKSKFMEIMSDIFSETGMKRYIFKNITPLMNKSVYDMTIRLGLDYIIKFNENMDCDVYYMNDKISYKSLSTGEKKKIDFAIILTFLDVLKLKFPNLNLLFLDEVFSSIDQNGINDISEMLNDISIQMGLNIFVINHVPLQVNQFKRVLKVTKSTGFSVLTEWIDEIDT